LKDFIVIGVFFILGIALWFGVTIVLSIKIPRWIGINQHTNIASVLLFPLVLVAPITDEVIGRWQFDRLCEREAVVTLSPDWVNVKRAKRVSLPRSDVDGYFIRIYSQGSEYIDIDTGITFMKHPHFYTYGGFLLNRLGLGLGESISCLPKNTQAIEKMINFYELLKQGESK
jgi:hypothetical protein